MAEKVTKRTLNSEAIKFMSLFSRVTRVNAKDCIDNNGKMIFIVDENLAGKAVGKKGFNVKILEKELHKKIKIIEYSKDPIQFIKNLVFPNKVKDIEADEGTYTITPQDSMSRSMLIGRNAVNLREYENILRRYFSITELKVK